MTKIVRCVNGHFYDAQKFDECPYCNKVTENRMEIEQYTTEGGRRFTSHSTDRNFETPQSFDPVSSYEQNSISRSMRSVSRSLNSVSRNRIEEIDEDDDPVTVGIFRHQEQGNELITGWLVCVEGPDRGRDYRIRHGNNWIGKSYNSDICIDGDTDIAYEKHCEVVYDAKSNTFFITPEKGTITYVNGQTLNNPQKLETGDSIKIGKSEFEFIPFCREGHVWD